MGTHYTIGFFNIMENTKIQCTKCSSLDYRVEQRSIHKTAYCNHCDSYIRNLPQGKPAMLFFGKFKDREISTMTSKEEVDYLVWMTKKLDIKPNSLKEAIQNHLSKVNK